MNGLPGAFRRQRVQAVALGAILISSALLAVAVGTGQAGWRDLLLAVVAAAMAAVAFFG